jgi:SAM-dependent methyltransferase
MGQSGVGYYATPEYKKHLGIALAYNHAVRWYFENKCPESKECIASLIQDTPQNLTISEVRASEIYVIQAQETFMVYLYPEVMESNCGYIRDWTPDRLLSIVDFTDKVVLDIGSGTGRLAFAAAQKAKKVYASEPVDCLREFMRDKIKKQGIKNMVVLDGVVENIPYEDNTFDIVMSACVFGDDYDAEYAEMFRVVKAGGYIIDCDGENGGEELEPRKKELLQLGFEYSHYISKNGGDVYRYWKQVFK